MGRLRGRWSQLVAPLETKNRTEHPGVTVRPGRGKSVGPRTSWRRTDRLNPASEEAPPIHSVLWVGGASFLYSDEPEPSEEAGWDHGLVSSFSSSLLAGDRRRQLTQHLLRRLAFLGREQVLTLRHPVGGQHLFAQLAKADTCAPILTVAALDHDLG